MTKEQMKQIYGKTLGGNQCFIINRHLAKHLESKDAALLFQHLLDIHITFFNHTDWFYKQYNRIANDLDVSNVKSIQRWIKTLKDIGLIDTKFEGMPPKTYYRINYENLQELMQKEVPSKVDLKSLSEETESLG